MEAIGTTEWTGTPLRGLLEEAGIGAGALEVLFTGLDQGVQGDEVQFYQRSLSLADALRDEVLLAYSMNGETLGKAVSPYAWREWSFRWGAPPGRHVLCVRATDARGKVQPLDQPWNYQGMANNMVQRVDVVVE